MPGLAEGTNTIFFIPKRDVPINRWRDVTYGRIVVNYRPEKSDPYGSRLTVGGDRINYPGDCGTSTVDLLTVKHILNSIISTPNAKFMTIDIKNFYLNTPMARSEFMRLKLNNLPSDVIAHYNLKQKSTADGWVYVEIKRGMYGLPQAGIIAQHLPENESINTVTSKMSSLPDCVLTNGFPSVSPFVWTILASNTLASNTLTIS